MPKYLLTPSYKRLIIQLLAFGLVLDSLFLGSSNKAISNQPATIIPPCDDFHNDTYPFYSNFNGFINTILINYSDIDESHATDCLSSLVKDGDHLLMEPDAPQIDQCSSKLHCHRFNFSTDEIISHRKELDNQHRLFVITQTDQKEFSSKLGKELNQNNESVTVLTSKQPGLSG